MQFEQYDSSSHGILCRKRHQFIGDDEPQPGTHFFSIRFRILHFYSPVHYKAEIFAQRGCNNIAWTYLDSQTKIIEIFLAEYSPSFHDKHEWKAELFDRIFNRINDPEERFELYEAKIVLKLKEIIFVERLRVWCRNDGHVDSQASFADDLRANSLYSAEIKNKLMRMHRYFIQNSKNV